MFVLIPYLIGLGVVSAFQSGLSRPSVQPFGKFRNEPRRSTLEPLSASSTTPGNDLFQTLTGFFSKKVEKVPEKPKIPDVIVDSDFSLSYLFLAIGLVIALTNPAKTCSLDSFPCFPSTTFGTIASGVHIFLATFFAIQAKRIRFVFDETAFELRIADTKEDLKDSGENIVVGGANRWDYDKFVNWDFFPSVDFPILVYFKEVQTPKVGPLINYIYIYMYHNLNG